VLAGSSSWRTPFFVTSGLLAVMFTVHFFVFPRGQRERGRRLAFGSRLVAPLKIAWVRSLYVSNTTNRMAVTILTTYFAAFLVVRYGLTVSQAAAPLVVLAVGLAAGSLAGGRVVKPEWHFRVGLAAITIAGVLGVALYVFSPTAAFATATAFVLTMLIMLANNVNVTSLLDVKGEMRASTTGMLAAFNQTGIVLGSALGGVAVALGHFSWLGALLLAAAWTSALTAMSSARLKRRGLDA
jgi:predicted MFS family arabinose efflux permease